jgi:hypothetical protein
MILENSFAFRFAEKVRFRLISTKNQPALVAMSRLVAFTRK